MGAGRFVVPSSLLSEGLEIELPQDVAHQARDVLRLAAGDRLTLLDGAGGEWPATVTQVERSGVRVRLSAPRGSQAEPRVRVVLCQGMLKASKLEWVLQKGTELGVSAFVPLRCERSVGGLEDLSGTKRTRWIRILEEATEQCGGARVPELSESLPLPRTLAELPACAVALIPWEEERGTPLRRALAEALDRDTGPTGGPARSRQPPEVHLFIGPEGGFSPGEIALARQCGVVPVTLGPRILRAETAAIAALALVMDVCGELSYDRDDAS